MWQWFRRPKTVDAAVRRLAIELPGDYLDFIRGTPSDEAFIGLDHFNLGLYVRNGFGV